MMGWADLFDEEVGAYVAAAGDGAVRTNGVVGALGRFESGAQPGSIINWQRPSQLKSQRMGARERYTVAKKVLEIFGIGADHGVGF